MQQENLELFPVKFVIFVSILQNPLPYPSTLCLREAIPKKNLNLFGKSEWPVFLESFKEIF